MPICLAAPCCHRLTGQVAELLVERHSRCAALQALVMSSAADLERIRNERATLQLVGGGVCRTGAGAHA